jgi:hypothetical protein
VVNNSTLDNLNALVYQTMPGQTADIYSLAWFSKAIHKDTQVDFSWEVNYSFTWAETGKLKPGVLFRASQNMPADLASNNDITLTYVDGGYKFIDQKDGIRDSLSIHEDSNVLSDSVSVGIGMSGSGVFATQGGPSLDQVFTPHPTYFVALGSHKQSQVIDITSMTHFAEVKFEGGHYSLIATIDKNNQWTVEPTSAVNAAFLEARKTNPHAEWGRK